MNLQDTWSDLRLYCARAVYESDRLLCPTLLLTRKLACTTLAGTNSQGKQEGGATITGQP
jgi:hypothetical protein